MESMFTRLKMQPRVRGALIIACKLAKKEELPIDAGYALLGAVTMSYGTESPAFHWLASKIKTPKPEQLDVKRNFDDNFDEYPLSESFEALFTFSLGFVKEYDKGLEDWEFVTIILLTKEDRHLHSILEENKQDLFELQQEWFAFRLYSEGSSTNPDILSKWWHSAGLDPPGREEMAGFQEKFQKRSMQEDPLSESDMASSERPVSEDFRPEPELKRQRTENIDPYDSENIESVQRPKQAQPKKKEIPSYLLAWDPQLFPFSPKMSKTSMNVMTNGGAIAKWSCGQADLPADARIFLVRHGDNAPGIVGSGISVKPSTAGPHWNPKSENKTTNFVDVNWDTFQKNPLLALDELSDKTGQKELWIKRSNGMEIKEPAATLLENAWAEAKSGIPPEIPDPPLFGNNDSPPSSSAESRKRLEATEKDRLNVKSQAKAFATLLISKSAKGPFAIALLGAWGVGKTHFMRIMQETIESVAGKRSFPERYTDTVSRVAQIEFNAWHYVDTSLWASLASHIFNELAKELNPADDPHEKVRLELRKKIFSSGQEIKKAEAAVEAAKTERLEALKKLEAAKNNRSEKLQRVWDALTNDPAAHDGKKLVELKKSTNTIVKNLGLSEPLKTAKDIENVHKSLSDIKGRGLALVGIIDTAFNSKNAFLSSFFLLVLVFLFFAFPWLIKKIDPTLLNGTILSPGIQVTTFLGPIMIWISKNLNSVSKAMGYLETIQGILESPPEGHEALKDEITQCDAAILAEKERVKKAEQEISRAQSEIQRINSGGLVYDFLEKKKADTRYIEKMGLISVIRKDFEELKSVLKEWNRNEKGVHPIERIVLYIDDLDRCPTKRVVEVLQAVHLLLAFDLFNVVVAVDARWLERSLNEAYNPSDIIRNGGSSFTGIPHRFSAHNYLEKIFQIPFSLPVMGKTGYQKLIENLVTPPNLKSVPEPRSSPDPEKVDQHENGQKTLDYKNKGDLSDPDGDEPAGDSIGDDQITDNKKNKAEDAGKINIDEIQILAEQEANTERVKAMELLPHEKVFIESLYEFIPTPRLANRFVNIYRMLRVRAKSLDTEMASFLSRETGDYRSVLVLLAIIIGHPRHAPELINALNHAPGNFLGWLDVMEGNDEAQDNISAQAKKELTKITRKIDSVMASLVESGGPGIDNDMEHYRKWANEVGRYSFRWHLKDDSGPGGGLFCAPPLSAEP